MQPVQIQGDASRGGAKLLLGSTALMLLLLTALPWLEQLSWWYAVLLVAAALGIFIGWAKLAEPKYFLQYDNEGVHYYHQRGSWYLPWQSFLYSGVPRFNEQQMAYIAFKLTDYDGFLQRLPLRLAVRLMTEQRALYLEAVRQACADGRCATELLSESEHFSTASGRYNGIKAAFGWRMQRLAEATGFDVFVPVSLNGAEAQQLCQQINQCRLQLIRNTVT